MVGVMCYNKNFMRALLTILTLLAITSCQSQPDKKDYPTFLKGVLAQRTAYKNAYDKAVGFSKDSLIKEARNYLVSTISEEVFPYWYGTPWDFNGTTRKPGQGKIACGYFVTTVLEDVGFNIPRTAWAQSASEVFIKKRATDNIKRFSNRPLSEVKNYLLAGGDGLYVVGLDIHVGFIVVKGKSISFVHSNYYQPEIGVMKQDIDAKSPFKDSNYRIIGKLMSDEMVVKWLNNTTYD